MKKLLLIAAVVMAFAAPIFAQSSFSDLPRDHWAYDAVSELEQLGLVVGYPNGTFQGKRTLTRYEFAMVISRLLPFLGDTEINVDGFLRRSDLNDYAKKSDIPDYKDADLSPYALKSALANIEKLVKEFQAELAALGVDVNVLKADVAALKSRVTALEEEVARVKVTGELNWTSIGIFGDERILDIDGRDRKNKDRDITFRKDVQLNVVGKVNNNINAYVSLVMGDFMAENQKTTILPYYMYAKSEDEKWGDIKVGRMPFQVNQYVVKRVDNDSYNDIARIDNGDYVYEGFDYTNNFGSLDVRLWGTKPWAQDDWCDWVDSTLSSDVNFYQYPYNFGLNNNGHNSHRVAYNVGAELAFNFSGINISGLFSQVATQEEMNNQPDRAMIYGGHIDAKLGQFGLGAFGYVQGMNADPVVGVKNAVAWDAYASFNNDTFNILAGYKEIQAGYATPGAWDKIGNLYNPNNIKGFYVNADVKFGNFKVYGTFKEYKIKDENYDNFYGYSRVIGGYFAGSTGKITNYKAGAEYALTELDAIYADYENVKYDYLNSDYITAGWMRKVGTNAKLKLMYQYVNNKEDILFDKTKGSIVNAQVTVNF